MYHCEICNRETFKKIRYGGYTLCSKHMHQLQKYKKFLDSNPRSQNDLNEFRIDKEKGIAIFDLYDKRQNKVNEFVIDLEDLEKVRYHKWRESYGKIVTGNGKRTKTLEEVISGTVTEEDYPYQKIKGIYKVNFRNANYSVEIRVNSKKVHLGYYKRFVEAVYARKKALDFLYGKENKENFSGFDFEHMESQRRKEIKDYVLRKIRNRV